MKKLVSVLFVLMLSVALFANFDGDVKTTKITGKVIDKVTGEALAGVCVKIENTDQTVYTDFDGNFEIKGLKPGKYSFTTNYVSYTKSYHANIDVDINKSNAITVKLSSIDN